MFGTSIESIEVVDSELVEFIDYLKRCMVSKDVKSDTRVRARDLLHLVCDSVYLRIVNTVNLIFQSITGNISNCLAAIDECKTVFAILPMVIPQKVDNNLQLLYQCYVLKQDRRPCRRSAPPRSMDDFIVDTHLPTIQAANDKCDQFRRTIVELQDSFLFSGSNSTIPWSAMEVLTTNF